MAVVAITEMKGDPRELLAKYDQLAPRMRERGPAPGLLVHNCIELDDGMRIANVWESEQRALDAFENEEFQAMLRSVGMEPVRPTIHKVHNHMNFAAGQGSRP